MSSSRKPVKKVAKRKITIKMPKALLAKWLKTLRGGRIKQGKWYLVNDDGAMCCLGVLQYCVGGRKGIERDSDGHSYEWPSMEWLRKYGVKFKDTGALGKSEAPFFPTLGVHAGVANDENYQVTEDEWGIPIMSSCPATFKQIADAIEACAEGY